VVRGFTLVEVIIVAVILAILVTVSVPRFQDSSRGFRAEQAAFSLVQLLRYAHQRAVFQGEAIAWVWDDADRRARLALVQEDADVWIEERAARSEPLMEDLMVHLTRQGAPVGHVTFFPDGTSDAAILSLQFRKHLYTVQVDAATSQAILTTGPAP
jgi:type II secretion system protein H